jgi:hypothetical protein
MPSTVHRLGVHTERPGRRSGLYALVAIVPVGSNKVSTGSEALVFWNVRGLNTTAHRNVVAKLVGQERVSLVCLHLLRTRRTGLSGNGPATSSIHRRPLIKPSSMVSVESAGGQRAAQD